MSAPPPSDFEVLVTAAQAWPAFERAVLQAETEVIGGFRIFDLATKLRSTEARAIGNTWFDLLEHVIRRGVRVHLILSDFDPVLATALHEQTWRSKRQAAALAEILGPEAAIRWRLEAHMHPACAGLVPRLAFMPAVLRRKAKRLRQLGRDRLQRQAVGLEDDSLPELHTVSHHQKMAVIDRQICYLGGLDQNERRFDTPRHDTRPAQTWSDVQLLVRGPEAAEAAAHLERFRDEIARGAAAPAGQHLRRTLSAPRKLAFLHLSPHTIAGEIEADHRHAFTNARQLLHIETQYFRATDLAEALAEAAGANTALRLILVLPGAPEEVAFEGRDGLDARYGMALQADCIHIIEEAFGPRASIASPVQPVSATGPDAGQRRTLAGSPLIHVHNKVLVADDDFALVGSANLNGRSLRWDTETALRLTDKSRVARLRTALYGHWWPDPVPDPSTAPERLFEDWQRRVAENGVRRPENRQGFLVPYQPDRLQDMRQPLPGVTEDIV